MALRRGMWLEIYAVNQLLGALLANVLKGTVGREFALYSALAGMEDATTTKVAGVLGLPLTTASDQLNRLVERGHARRDVNPTDARSFVFSLTPAGKRAVLEQMEAFGNVTRRVRRRLRVPEPQIREGLVALETALREELEQLDPKNTPPP